MQFNVGAVTLERFSTSILHDVLSNGMSLLNNNRKAVVIVCCGTLGIIRRNSIIICSTNDQSLSGLLDAHSQYEMLIAIYAPLVEIIRVDKFCHVSTVTLRGEPFTRIDGSYTHRDALDWSICISVVDVIIYTPSCCGCIFNVRPHATIVCIY